MNGMKKLLESSKGTLSLLIIACATVAVMLSKIDGTAYAAVIGSVVAIYNFVRMKTDVASLNVGGE